MNRIEKAEWAAAMLGGSGARSCRGPPLPGPGGTAAPAVGSGAWRSSRWRGRGAAPQPRYPAPSGLPFICWLCHFLSIADPFSVPSVISNNVTASLESIHQSRKKPMLTLIKKKKKYHLCLMGKRSQPNLWRPRPPPPPARLPFEGAPGVIRFRGGGVPAHRWAPCSPAHSPELSRAGETGSERGLNPGSFPAAKESDLTLGGFKN